MYIWTQHGRDRRTRKNISRPVVLKVLLSASMLCMLAAALTSCGNSGAGSSGLPASRNDTPGNAPADGNTQRHTAVKLSGLVSAGVVANAAVTFTVGSQTFFTTTNSVGEYSITLSIADDNLEKPILAVAKGSAVQPEIELVSVLPSATTLIQNARNGDIVDRTSAFAVNITSVSTAKYVSSGNVVMLPSSDRALIASAFGACDGGRKFDIAVLLQLAATNKAYLQSSGAKTTLDLATNNFAQNKLWTEINAQNPTLLASTLGNIEANENLVAISKFDPVGRYITRAIIPPNNQTFALDFNFDGTGGIIGEYADSPMRWIKVDGKIIVTPINALPVAANGFQYDLPSTDPFIQNRVWVMSYLSKLEIRLIEKEFEFGSAEVLATVSIRNAQTLESYETSDYVKSCSELVSAAQTLLPQAGIFSGIWYYDRIDINRGGFVKSTQFDSNGTLVTKPLDRLYGDPPGDLSSGQNWSLANNNLKRIDQNNSENISETYFIQDLGVGYQVAIVNHKNGVSTVEQGVFIQQHDDSKLTEKDFTGFFSNDGGFYELIASDHLVFPYFGGWNFLQLMTWSFDGQRHSVNVDTFIDISCTFSGGNGCFLIFVLAANF